MKKDTQNLLLAIGLSILVLVGWQYFIGAPQMEKQREAQRVAQQQAAAQKPMDPATGAPANVPLGSPNPNGGAAPTTPQAFASREEALKQSPRVPLETGSLFGSIALKGGRIDDVSLRNFRETVDPKSPNIILLSPSGAPQPYYAEVGFVGPAGQSAALPGSDTLWQAQAGAKLTADRPVTLTWDNGQGLVFSRTIAVDNDFLFTVNDSVANKSGNPVTLYPYSLVSRHGTPHTSGYAVLHEGLIGLVGDSGIQEFTYDKIGKETGARRSFEGVGGWLGFTDTYWGAVVAPDQNVPFKGSLSVTGTTTRFYQADAFAEAKTIAPGASADTKTFVFAGAKVNRILERYEADPGIKKLSLMIDWGWFYFLTRPMFRLLEAIYHLVGNFGVAILIVTVLVKLAFLPLANKSYMSMAKMKALQPEIKKLQELYPDDKMKQQQEQMALFKREKVNPVAGCLPIAIQIPVFFALYKVLLLTIDLRQAPFFGWIHDLSQPDPTNIFTLFGLIPWNPTHLPVFGSFLHLGIWPLIMGASMWLQMKMNPEPTDPVQKTMFAWMPVIFTFTLGSFPVGLVIYWTWNNLLSVLQQGFIMKRAGVKFDLWDNLAKTFKKKSDAQQTG